MEFTLLATELWEIQKIRKSYEEKEEQLKQQIKSICNDENYSAGGFTYSYIIRKGNVDYSRIPELKSINLDDYRKEDVKQWKLSKD